MFIAALTLLTPFMSATVYAESITPTATNVSSQDILLAPVILDGITLFNVRGVSAFPADRRANEIAARIEHLASDREFDPDNLQVLEKDGMSTIVAADRYVMSVLDEDALLEKVERKVLAEVYLSKIREMIKTYRLVRTPKVLTEKAIYIAIATLVFLAFIWLGRRVMIRSKALLDLRLRTKLEGLESQSFQIVRAKQIWAALEGFLRVSWLLVSVLAGLFYLEFVLSSLPWTRSIADSLLAILTEPLEIMVKGVVGFIPDLAFLIILFFVVRFILKALQIFFGGIAHQAIRFENFDADWAWPTYRLVKLLIIAFSLVIAFPYIPGSDSDAFKGISVFLGIIFSLSSSSIIANSIAGYTVIYRRAFKLGDRIRVGEDVGDVTAIRQLVTHLRTIKNEEIVVPNSSILNSSVVNYSTLARQGRLILHTTVGIGYETPWRQVEAMLLQAAARTKGLIEDPPPFVLQKSLGDFCVTYELNVHCDNAQAMSKLYSELHRNILDLFNEFGVQIMTPAYEGDPSEPKIVPKESWYLPPAKPLEE